MNVQQLIQELEKHPKDMLVTIPNSSFWLTINHVKEITLHGMNIYTQHAHDKWQRHGPQTVLEIQSFVTTDSGPISDDKLIDPKKLLEFVEVELLGSLRSQDDPEFDWSWISGYCAALQEVQEFIEDEAGLGFNTEMVEKDER